MRYDRIGMYCSFCAVATLAAPTNNMPTKARKNHFMTASYDRRPDRRPKPKISPSIRERPQPHFFLGDLPDPRQPVRLDDQEENDQPAEYHQLEVRPEAAGNVEMQCVVEEGDADAERDRQHDDECASEERSKHGPDAADNDHEKNAEGQVEVVGFRLDGAEIGIGEQRAGHAAIERADGER